MDASQRAWIAPRFNASFAAFATDGRDGLARLAAGAGLHFVPQVWFLRASPGARGEAVDAGLRVLRFEDLFAARGDAFIAALVREFPELAALEAYTFAHRTTPWARGKYCDAYTPEAARAVAEVYREDIAALSYEYECDDAVS